MGEGGEGGRGGRGGGGQKRERVELEEERGKKMVKKRREQASFVGVCYTLLSRLGGRAYVVMILLASTVHYRCVLGITVAVAYLIGVASRTLILKGAHRF